MLRDEPAIATAQRIAYRFPGVSPMDILRGDHLEWQVWSALADSYDADVATRAAQ